MPKFIECYNENESCEECSKKPVRIILIKEDDKFSNLCLECFNNLGKKEELDAIRINSQS